MVVGAYAVPLDPPVVVYAVQMEPETTIGPMWPYVPPYVPQTITPEMIRTIVREELERYGKKRKKRGRK
jgi:hypothetical protein